MTMVMTAEYERNIVTLSRNGLPLMAKSQVAETALKKRFNIFSKGLRSVRPNKKCHYKRGKSNVNGKCVDCDRSL